jgi:site-specific recombinase
MYDPVCLKEIIEHWQEYLRLRDWLVVTKIVDEDDDDIRDNAGQIDIRQSVFEAVVELNSGLEDEDIEPTIYHELAHIQVKSTFWLLRQVLDGMEAEGSNVLSELLSACEEEQVRHIEFLISRMMNRERYVLREKEGEDERGRRKQLKGV